jgi:pentatricopeptide repeat protein
MQGDTPEFLRESTINPAILKNGKDGPLVPESMNKVQHLQDNSGDHANILAAVSVFHEMQQFGLKPNVVTFSAILNACRLVVVFILHVMTLIALCLTCSY